MRLTHALAPLLCLACVASAARADDATRRAKVEQMLQITRAEPALEEQIKNLRGRIGDLAKQQFGPAPLSPDQVKLKDDYLKQVDAMTTGEIGWDKLRPLVVQIYMDGFTEPELDGIIAFYKTPAGQALIAKSPDVLGKTNTTITARIKDIQPKLQELTQTYGTRIKDAGSTAPATGSAPSTPAPSSPAAPPRP